MQNTKERLKSINKKIAEIAEECNRDPQKITLVAVSKGHGLSKIKEAYEAFQIHFAESYLKEALPKIDFFKKSFFPYPIWHFIGPIQSNKTKLIAENFAWVQSIDREKIAILLNKHRPVDLPKLNVCIEVNINQEKTKAGITPQEAINFAKKISTLPNLNLRGLMAIPEATPDEKKQQANFNMLFCLYNELRCQGFLLDTLSMGMSQDFVAAIKSGSNMLRIGSAIFGERIDCNMNKNVILN